LLAIEANYFSNYPGVTAQRVRKYLPTEHEITTMGHMKLFDQQKQKKNKTKVKTKTKMKTKMKTPTKSHYHPLLDLEVPPMMSAYTSWTHMKRNQIQN